jgi:hypothetical protein
MYEAMIKEDDSINIEEMSEGFYMEHFIENTIDKNGKK